MNPDQHIENVLSSLREVFKATSERIESLEPGIKIPATELANQVAKDFECKMGLTGAQLYHFLIPFFENYPGISRKRGRNGGISKEINQENK